MGEEEEEGRNQAQVPQIRSMSFSLSMGDLHRQRITRGDMFIVRVINVHHQYHQNPESWTSISSFSRVCVSSVCYQEKKVDYSMLCGLGSMRWICRAVSGLYVALLRYSCSACVRVTQRYSDHITGSKSKVLAMALTWHSAHMSRVNSYIYTLVYTSEQRVSLLRLHEYVDVVK
jgi:hypothetical protein